MSKMVGFVDVSPSKDRKVCYNCEHFCLWGVHMGYCPKKDDNVMDCEKACEENYVKRTKSHFEEE